MKALFNTVIGVLGAYLTFFFGGVDTLLVIIAIFAGFDYVTGLIVALVFHNSPKTATGGANSMVGFRGICKKLVMGGMIGVANMLDIALGVDFIRGGVMYAFLANETISIIENAGCMGIPIPGILRKAIDILAEKEENHEATVH